MLEGREDKYEEKYGGGGKSGNEKEEGKDIRSQPLKSPSHKESKIKNVYGNRER